MVMKGIDCASRLTEATAAGIKGAGHDYVFRYLGDPTNWKTLLKDEVSAIIGVGLKIVSIWESNPTHSEYFTFDKGKSDAQEACKWAKEIGQPAGSAIYFTVDFDAQKNHLPAIVDYFSGIREGSITIIK